MWGRSESLRSFGEVDLVDSDRLGHRSVVPNTDGINHFRVHLNAMFIFIYRHQHLSLRSGFAIELGCESRVFKVFRRRWLLAYIMFVQITCGDDCLAIKGVNEAALQKR